MSDTTKAFIFDEVRRQVCRNIVNRRPGNIVQEILKDLRQSGVVAPEAQLDLKDSGKPYSDRAYHCYVIIGVVPTRVEGIIIEFSQRDDLEVNAQLIIDGREYGRGSLSTEKLIPVNESFVDQGKLLAFKKKIATIAGEWDAARVPDDLEARTRAFQQVTAPADGGPTV